MHLLEFEQNLIVDTFGESFLLITAEGLMIDRLFFKHLELYSDPSVLVLVLNTSNQDQEYFLRLLREERKRTVKSIDSASSSIRHVAPKQFNATINAEERKSVYLQGGIIFGTTRIFVTDILKKLIPFHLVTGILFYRAHTVLRSSLESFIIRSFREVKPDGFVKAFSDNSRAFASGGIGALQRAVSALRVDRVRFLPRYHADVIAALERAKPDLIEIPVQLRAHVKAIEACLLELIMACMQELKHCSPGVIWEDMDMENALSRGFEKTLQRRLEEDRRSFNDQLSSKARDLLTDISRLRQLLNSLENDDAKTFATLLKTVRGDGRDLRNSTYWMFTPSAQKIFDIALSKRRQDETPSKWEALISVIREVRSGEVEIDSSSAAAASDDQPGTSSGSTATRPKPKSIRMIVLADDERICAQLGETMVLNDQSLSDIRVVIGWKPDDWASIEDRIGQFIVFIPLADRYQISTALVLLKPTSVVLYNVDVWIVRQVEIYEASRVAATRDDDEDEDGSGPLKVYMLMYENSSEEQRYLTSLKNERDSFDQLFREDAALLIRKADDKESYNQSSQPTIEGNHTIVVDLREFRSELPTLLHIRGVHVAPVTLTIGDYVLTPAICVERKATSDLVSSLQTGRLYDQCKSMCEFYERPLILIELDERARGRRSWRRLGDGLAAKLASMTLHFNRIRLLWATGPSAACDLLLDIKWKREDPSIERAVEMGKNDEDVGEHGGGQSVKSSSSSHRVKSWAEYLLMCLPDANATNIRQIIKTSTDLRSLCRTSKSELGQKLNSDPWGSRIFEFVNRDFRQKAPPEEKNAAKRGKKRRI